MKKTTENIYKILKSDNFKDLSKLQESVIAFGWEEEIYQELNFNDAFIELMHIIDILSDTITKNNLFENISNYQARTSILNNLNNINSYISNIKNGTNQIAALIQMIEATNEIFHKFNFELYLKGSPLYYEKLREVNYLKSKYISFISKLEKTEKVKKSIENIHINVKTINSEINEIKEKVVKTTSNIDSVKDDIDQRYEAIKVSNKNITEYELLSQQNKDAINDFFQDIEKFEDKMNDGIITLNESVASSKTAIDDSIIKYEKETKAITEKNTEIQKEIMKLLGKTIGTNLYKSFNKKVRWMRGQSIAWLLLLIGSIGFLSVIGKDVIQILGELLKNSQNNNFGLSFYLKTTLIFPAIYAIYFSASQFKSTNKLLEEYDFKSAVSVVLHYFKEQVEKSKTDPKTQDFLIRSIENIFESPTDKVFGKKLSTRKKESLLNEIVDFTKDKVKNNLPTD